MRFTNPGGASASIAAFTTISPESSTARAATNQAQSHLSKRPKFSKMAYTRRRYPPRRSPRNPTWPAARPPAKDHWTGDGLGTSVRGPPCSLGDDRGDGKPVKGPILELRYRLWHLRQLREIWASKDKTTSALMGDENATSPSAT